MNSKDALMRLLEGINAALNSDFARSRAEVGEELRKSLEERVREYENSTVALIQKLLLLKFYLEVNSALEDRQYDEIPDNPPVKVG